MLRLGTATALGAQSVDAAVNPEYRGRHVFTDLARTALREVVEEGIQPLFAFPTIGAYGGQVRVGFKSELTVPKAYRPLAIAPRRRRFAGFTLGETTSFDERFDVFSRSRDPGEVSVQRDARYLQWRHCEHPTQAYVTITCERTDGELCGYSVLTVRGTRRWARPGYVVDLETLPGDEAAAEFLAYHSIRRLRSMGARVGVSWERPAGVEQAALASAGFSSRYVSMRRRLSRPDYVDQLIAFEDTERLQEATGDAAGPPPRRWSIVPGDADYI
jgi:hypothetical protein